MSLTPTTRVVVLVWVPAPSQEEEGSAILRMNNLFCPVSKSNSNKVGVNINSEVLIK